MEQLQTTRNLYESEPFAMKAMLDKVRVVYDVSYLYLWFAYPPSVQPSIY
jgi:hypothetical protein